MLRLIACAGTSTSSHCVSPAATVTAPNSVTISGTHVVVSAAIAARSGTAASECAIDTLKSFLPSPVGV
ncbi:MAG: hypothetical protein ACYTDU_20045 [Planctomycetota bacterium]|jgi:hypothetical protein